MKPQMAVPTGFEPAISCVTGRHVRPLHHGTIWLRELDLNQRPLGYEPNELPNCSIPRYKFNFGGGKGIRTPAPVTRPSGFQDRSLQPAWVFLQLTFLVTKRLYHITFLKVNKEICLFSFNYRHFY